MGLPSKAEIAAKAKELWHKQNPDFESNPEACEIAEEGFAHDARMRLMSSKYTKSELEQWKGYTEDLKAEVTKEIPFDVSEALASGFVIFGTRQLSGKTTLAKHLAERLMRSGIAVHVLDVSKAWLHETPIMRFVRVPRGRGELSFDHVRSTVFDMSMLNYGERLSFVKGLCSGLYDRHVQGYANPEVVVFEEAQTYLPNGCMRSRKYSEIVDFATVGGNFGLSFGLISQFPASVDKCPVKLAQQRYFGLTTEYNDKKYIQSFLGKERIPELVGLQLGQFLFQSRNRIEKFQCQRFGLANGISLKYAEVLV